MMINWSRSNYPGNMVWLTTGHWLDMRWVLCVVLYCLYLHILPSYTILRSSNQLLEFFIMWRCITYIGIRIPFARINDFSITPLKHQLCEIQDKLIILIFIFIVSCSSVDDQLCEVFNELRNELFDMDEDQDNEEG